MSKLESIVPPLELCKLIPAGATDLPLKAEGWRGKGTKSKFCKQRGYEK